MSVFRPFQGAGVRSALYHARVRGLRGRTVQISLGVKTERAAEVLEQKIIRLRDLRLAGEALDAATQAWVHGLTPELSDQLLKHGFLAERDAGSRRSVVELIEEWRRSLIVGGALEAHAHNTTAPVLRAAHDCGWYSIADITPTSVEGWLMRRIRGAAIEAEQRAAAYEGERRQVIAENEGRKPESKRRLMVPPARNFAPRFGKATAARAARYMVQFGLWLKEHNMASRAPLEGWTRPDGGPTKKRQAFTPDQLRKLLATTEADREPRMGMSGTERALLYHLAACTGCRSNEFRQARAGWFKLDAAVPSFDVPPEFTKNRKGASMPLVDPGLVASLRAHLSAKLPGAAAFAMPDKPAAMLRADLNAAGIPAKAGDGMVFHSLKHAFVTMLGMAGVQAKLIQRLARHSSIKTTMEIYNHADMVEAAGALATLPPLRVSG